MIETIVLILTGLMIVGASYYILFIREDPAIRAYLDALEEFEAKQEDDRD